MSSVWNVIAHLGSASDWLKQISHAARPTRGTIQIWLMTRHQYGISGLVAQTSFRGETSGSVAKCRLFNRATKCHYIYLDVISACNTFSIPFLPSSICLSNKDMDSFRRAKLWSVLTWANWKKRLPSYRDRLQHPFYHVNNILFPFSA